jgi:hypothetical protein
MSAPRPHLGDSHNFGRRVELRGGRIRKPRTVVWERLVLSAKSPLRRLLDAIAREDGLGDDAFAFLPDLAFRGGRARHGGDVERLELRPLPRPSRAGRRALARIVGRSLALFSWLGLTDLHWENLALGVDARGRMVFGPLDVEMILADLSMPTETKLLPDADPEVADVCRHACGVRRVLPYLGKPVGGADLASMAAAYVETLASLDRHAHELAAVFASLPELGEAPIRVLLRGTDEYVRARSEPVWPPLLGAEAEQLARGDIPYFFRLYGRPGIHYFGDPTLAVRKTLPRRGDVPQLDPVLEVSRGFRSPSRARLREEGLFTLLGAFDHAALAGRFADGEVAVTFRPRTLVVELPGGEELSSRRNLSAFVGSVYLPCRCGEVRSVFVPPVTVCEAGAAAP